jgi:hypothetical protein
MFDAPEPGGWFFLNVGSGGILVDTRDSAGGNYDIGISDPVVTDDEWHHLGFAIDRERHIATLYIDGESTLVLAKPETDGLFGVPPPASRFAIGSQLPEPSLSLAGIVDEVWIFRRAVGAAEAAALFEGPHIASGAR